MKRTFTLALATAFALLHFNFIFSQSCNDCRYLAPIFDSVTMETVHFGQGVTADGDTQQLYMDIYQPYGDTVTNRPLLIFEFGGAFVQGSRDDWYVVEICKHFTKAGYVCAAPDYRLGITANEIIFLQFMRIFFRPMQDMRAAVQFFKADYSVRGNNYNIDTSRIILGGASSGAITALMTAYCDKSSEMAQMGNLSVLDPLGGFYSTSGTDTGYSWKGLATVNISGAMINADWVEPGDVPIISAHGNADQVVAYADGPGSINLIGFDLQGSYLVDSVARTKGVCSYLYTMEGQDHPSEAMGMEYIMSVVNRVMIRMHAVINRKSFCCPLSVDIQPGDTLYMKDHTGPVELNAVVSNDSGSTQHLQWCSQPCRYASSTGTFTFPLDTTLEFVDVVVSEGGCENGDLYILMDSSVATSLADLKTPIPISVYPQPASEYFTLSANLNENYNQKITVEIYSVEGRKILSSGNLPVHSPEITINTKSLQNGNYLLVLKSATAVIGARIISIEK